MSQPACFDSVGILSSPLPDLALLLSVLAECTGTLQCQEITQPNLVWVSLTLKLYDQEGGYINDDQDPRLLQSPTSFPALHVSVVCLI